ncbi:hypothetical protein KUV50_07005 [Membranicola marinus]|uniref:Uncharacterized protein n=1 Tax=Membranihabitans marinus TaxID=1227546 RepID=A0A953HWJ1_9BACT|nr:hypothetical protein [Membranihabitans marinus]MBY5957871.1 hypothetical protein [Membranihabitans marinus]
MILLFDTSAAGKPKSYKKPYTDTFNWPRMIHISWLAYDDEGNLVEDENHLIKNHALEIPEKSLRLHKLDLNQIEEEGKDIEEVLNKFKTVVDKAEYIFSFNLNYNENVVGAEYVRHGINHRLHHSEKYCLMQESTYFCKLEGRDGRYKWPTLTELHVACFDAGYAGPNNARNDVLATTKCFNHLWQRGELDDIF